jgi:hypothetical protein
VFDVDEDLLRSTVADLMRTFRDALIVFVPIAERLRLEWGGGYQHRDWERLAETLFDVCVRGPVEADSKRLQDEFTLPRYDIDADSYDSFSWISTTGGPPCAFIRLMTDSRPFDTVQLARLNPTTLVPVERVVIPFEQAEFVYVRRSKNRADVDICEIEAIE